MASSTCQYVTKQPLISLLLSSQLFSPTSEANMSEGEKANRKAIPSGDSSQSQLPEIVTDGNHMSIDELLKVIKGANVIPLLLVPSSNGRLEVVAVDGLTNLVRANHKDNKSDEKKQEAFRSWLMLLASLVATVTYTAGLSPPGGFWSVDDAAKGYAAGTSIMRDKYLRRYSLFHYCTTTAFFAALMVIGMLAKNKEITVVNNKVFGTLVSLCFLSSGCSYVAGTSVSLAQSVYSTTVFVIVCAYFSLQWFLDFIALFQGHKRSSEFVA